MKLSIALLSITIAHVMAADGPAWTLGPPLLSPDGGPQKLSNPSVACSDGKWHVFADGEGNTMQLTFADPGAKDVQVRKTNLRGIYVPQVFYLWQEKKWQLIGQAKDTTGRYPTSKPLLTSIDERLILQNDVPGYIIHGRYRKDKEAPLRSGLATLGLLVHVKAPSAKTNVLFISVDDMGSVLGSSGHPLAKTPHLDRLGASGVRFDRAYCQIPLCNPSRASLMTGQRPDACGVFDLERHFREQTADVVTLPQHFKNNGWFTARVGKLYHYDVPKDIGTNGLDDHPSWNSVSNPKGRDVTDESQIINPTPEKPVSAALSWLAADGSDEEQTDGMIATEAIRLLEQHREKPFFIAAGFFRPHTPFVAPKKYFDLYPIDQIKLPESPANDREDIPPAAFAHNNLTPNYGLPGDTCREALRAYIASVSFVDAQIGRVLDALERLDLARNTTVVFWSDHGYHLGEHGGIWQKRTLFEESARSPLIIRAPDAAGNGRGSQRIVEFVDIYPTLTDLAGLTAPKHLAGRTLRPLLDDPAGNWPHAAFTQILRPGDGTAIMGRSIRTEQWRYTEWNEGRAGTELYDHLTDANEFVNLAQQPDKATLITELRALLEQHAGGSPPGTPFDPKRL